MSRLRILREAGLDLDDLETLIEHAFWEFDARRNGSGPWQAVPQSERDAFKWPVRWLVARLLPKRLKRLRAPAITERTESS
jgi:hypothetical protein